MTNVKERYGFKFAYGDVLQMIGRVPATKGEYRAHDPCRLRVVRMALCVGADGHAERSYGLRSISLAGHFALALPTNLNEVKIGLLAVSEAELEPFVPDATPKAEGGAS